MRRVKNREFGPGDHVREFCANGPVRRTFEGRLQSGDRLHLDKERLLDEPVDH